MDDPVDYKEDALFEPTVDMMVNDFDDEATLEEEENLADPSQDQNELDSLQREGELPLEELLRLYNCPPPPMSSHTKPRKPRKRRKRIETPPPLVNNSQQHPEEDEEETEQPTECKSARLSEEGGDSSLGDDQKETLSVADTETVLEDPPASLPDSSSVTAGCGDDDEDDELDGPSVLAHLLDDGCATDEEEADYDYYPDETDLKKSILVGENHQALIPDSILPRKELEEISLGPDQLLWSPHTDKVNDGAVERFLAGFYKLRRHLNHPEEQPGVSPEELLHSAAVSNDVASATAAAHRKVVKDEECALKNLLEADYNVEVALQQVCTLMQANGGLSVPSSYCNTAPTVTWTEEECRNFELGIRLYGKNFTLIQATKVPSRTVQDLVQFYYFWKKTERYDSFAAKQRLEKKRHSSMSNQNPGLTEFMDKFLEEQQQRSISPRQNSVTTTPSPPVSMMMMSGQKNRDAGHAGGGGSDGGVRADDKASLMLGSSCPEAVDSGILDGNHSLLIYADSKRHRTSGGPTTPPVSSATDARHPLEELTKAGKEISAGGAEQATTVDEAAATS